MGNLKMGAGTARLRTIALIAAMAVAVSLSFTSCSDDKEEESGGGNAATDAATDAQTVEETKETDANPPLNFESMEITDEILAAMVESGEIPADVESLDLSGNEITDVSPLTGLKNLKNLTLGYYLGNKISDVSPLAEMTWLETLYLSKNEISDVSELSTLVNLKELMLDGNDLTESQIEELQESLPNCYISIEE